MSIIYEIKRYLRYFIYGIVLLPIFVYSVYWAYLVTIAFMVFFIIYNTFWSFPFRTMFQTLDEFVFSSIYEKESIDESINEKKGNLNSNVTLNNGFERLEVDLQDVLKVCPYAADERALYDDVSQSTIA